MVQRCSRDPGCPHFNSLTHTPHVFCPAETSFLSSELFLLKSSILHIFLTYLQRTNTTLSQQVVTQRRTGISNNMLTPPSFPAAKLLWLAGAPALLQLHILGFQQKEHVPFQLPPGQCNTGHTLRRRDSCFLLYCRDPSLLLEPACHRKPRANIYSKFIGNSAMSDAVPFQTGERSVLSNGGNAGLKRPNANTLLFGAGGHERVRRTNRLTSIMAKDEFICYGNKLFCFVSSRSTVPTCREHQRLDRDAVSQAVFDSSAYLEVTLRLEMRQTQLNNQSAVRYIFFDAVTKLFSASGGIGGTSINFF